MAEIGHIAGSGGSASSGPPTRRVDSERRSLAARALDGRALCIATRLRGADALTAVLTVTDDRGTVHYDGPLGADGMVTVGLADMPVGERVRVMLETARGHRQSDVILLDGVTEYAFA